MSEFVTIREAANAILSNWTDKVGLPPDLRTFRHLRLIAQKTVLDFYCVLKYRQLYEELWQDDEGILKLVSLLKPPDSPRFGERYQRAVRENDSKFLCKYRHGLMSECLIDRRTITNQAYLRAKEFLFFNWVLPILNPELDRGLAILSYAEIVDTIQIYFGNVGVIRKNWTDVNRIKQELFKLRLQQTPEIQRIAAARLSQLFKSN